MNEQTPENETTQYTERGGDCCSNDLLAEGNLLTVNHNASPLIEDAIFFKIEGEEIMRLDKEGMTYKGELINDAGVIYNLMRDYLSRPQKLSLS